MNGDDGGASLDVAREIAFLVDLNRLLREGLVAIDHDGHELPPPCAGPRFQITPRGLAQTRAFAPLRAYEQDHAPLIEIDEAWTPSS